MKTYRVVIGRDPNDDAWLVSVPDQPGCHTYGRTLVSARERAREALALWLDVEPDAIDIEWDLRLPEEARERLEAARAAREDADRAQATAKALTDQALRRLREAGLGNRDAGDLLGISHQRVAQLLNR